MSYLPRLDIAIDGVPDRRKKFRSPARSRDGHTVCLCRSGDDELESDAKEFPMMGASESA